MTWKKCPKKEPKERKGDARTEGGAPLNQFNPGDQQDPHKALGHSTSCPGGHGGGILYFGAHTVLLEGANAVTSEGGSTEHWASGTFTYGAGGGAGGSIFILSDTIELVSDAILADGGLGQSSYIRAGGDGGDGRIRIDCNTCGGYAQGSSEAETALQSGCSPAPGHSTVSE